MRTEAGRDCYVVAQDGEGGINILFRGSVDACQKYMEGPNHDGNLELLVPMLLAKQDYKPSERKMLFSATQYSLTPKKPSRRGTNR